MNASKYRRHMPLMSLNFTVSDHLVICGQTTWQIRNIAATSIGRVVIPLNTPEPVFNVPLPRFKLPFKGMFWCVGLLSVLIQFALGQVQLTLGLAAAMVFGVVYLVRENWKREKAHWQAEKERTDKLRQIWQSMRNDLPILFRLMLETNAGSTPLFYSLDEVQIKMANEAIIQLMEKKDSGEVHFQIETVNLGGESAINNFGSTIYEQSIQEL